MTDASANLRRNRLKLLLLFVLFFAPTLTAWYLIETGWRPGGMANHGDLVQPVQPLEELPLRSSQGEPVGAEPFLGRWTVLLSAAGGCSTECMQTLAVLGRAHVALNKDADRVQVGLVLPPQAPAPELPERVLRLEAPPELLQEWSPPAPAAELAVHIVDPRGMRMMAYPVPLDGSGLLKDLRRLLRLSNEEAERLRARQEVSE